MIFINRVARTLFDTPHKEAHRSLCGKNQKEMENMPGVKEFKEKIMSDEAFAKKFENVETPEDVVSIAAKEGFSFTADDVKNNTALTEIELKAVAGGAAATIIKPGQFVKPGVIFASGGFVKY
jgi:predicted ribosomally synthesized peptide with nif11-like leader